MRIFGPDGAVAMALARQLGLPLIVSFHGTDATLKDDYARRSYLTQRLYLLRRSRLAQFAVRIIAQSEYINELLLKTTWFSKRENINYPSRNRSQLFLTQMISSQNGDLSCMWGV